jgi:hypothetical protein
MFQETNEALGDYLEGKKSKPVTVGKDVKRGE